MTRHCMLKMAVTVCWCMLVVYAQCSDETTHIIHVRIYVFVQKRDVQTIAEVSIQPCSFHTHTFRSRSHSTNIHISVWRIFTCVCGSALYAMCDPLVPLSLYPAHTHADKYTQNSNDNVQFTSTYHFEILINIFVNGEWWMRVWCWDAECIAHARVLCIQYVTYD